MICVLLSLMSLNDFHTFLHLFNIYLLILFYTTNKNFHTLFLSTKIKVLNKIFKKYSKCYTKLFKIVHFSVSINSSLPLLLSTPYSDFYTFLYYFNIVFYKFTMTTPYSDFYTFLYYFNIVFYKFIMTSN